MWTIERQSTTGLWLISYNGRAMGRAASVSNAINLARIRTTEINDPVTGQGPGTIEPLDAATAAALEAQAENIQQQEARALAANTQGSGAESAGETTTEAQQARDNGANTTVPEPNPSRVTAQGDVVAQPTTQVPSNAESSEPVVPETAASPPKLPAGTVTGTNNTATVPAGSTSPRPATQVTVTGSTITPPDENTNLVSYIYRARTVTSNFRQGKFTQELEGDQVFFTLQTRPNRNSVVTGSEAIRDETGQVSNIRRNTETGELYVATPGVTYADVAPSYDYTGASPPGQPPVDSRTTNGAPTAAVADENPPATAPLITQPPTSDSTNLQTRPVPGTEPTQQGADASVVPQQGAREY